jgi:hypothetical protein
MTSLRELRDRARQEAESAHHRFQTWQMLAKSEAEQQRFPVVDPASKIAMGVGIAVGVLVFTSAFLLGPVSRSPAAVAAIPIGAVMVPASFLLRRRNPLASRALHQWQAFRRYLTDFSELKQYPAPAIELWDQYLVYAITLGVADRVIEQFQSIYPRVAPDDGQPRLLHNWVGADGQPFSLSGFDAVGHAFSSFGQAMPPHQQPHLPGEAGSPGRRGGGGGGADKSLHLRAPRAYRVVRSPPRGGGADAVRLGLGTLLMPVFAIFFRRVASAVARRAYRHEPVSPAARRRRSACGACLRHSSAVFGRRRLAAHPADGAGGVQPCSPAAAA